MHHRFSRAADLSLGAGAGVFESQEVLSLTRVGRRLLEIQPVASASLTETLSARGATGLAVTARLAPFTDPRSGLPSERLQFGASLADQVTPAVVATAAVSLLQSAPIFVHDPFPLTAVSGSVEVRVRVVRQLLDVGLGEQELWQTQSGYGTLFSLIGYVSATVHSPALRF
jgi:hypothetical protein